jgi:rhodanese-related sulfurtransferase
LSTDIRLALALAIGVGLSGCGSGSRNGSDGVASLPDGGVLLPDSAASVPDSVASLPDGAAAGAEAAVPAPPDVGIASEAGAPADRLNGAVEAGREAAVASADASVDLVAMPPDGPSAKDSLQVTPDVAAAEVVVRMDAAEAQSRPDTDGLDVAKPADVMAVEAARPAGDLAPAKLVELSPQQLYALLANKDFLLVDVHYPNAGSIPGTDARIAFDDIPALVAFIGPNLDTKVVLTCFSGGMSKTAGDALVARGYRNVSELTGGTNAWTRAGYTLVRLDAGL